MKLEIRNRYGVYERVCCKKRLSITTSVCLCRTREAFPQGGIRKGRIKRGKIFEQQYNDETFSFFFPVYAFSSIGTVTVFAEMKQWIMMQEREKVLLLT